MNLRQILNCCANPTQSRLRGVFLMKRVDGDEPRLIMLGRLIEVEGEWVWQDTAHPITSKDVRHGLPDHELFRQDVYTGNIGPLPNTTNHLDDYVLSNIACALSNGTSYALFDERIMAQVDGVRTLGVVLKPHTYVNASDLAEMCVDYVDDMLKSSGIVITSQVKQESVQGFGFPIDMVETLNTTLALIIANSAAHSDMTVEDIADRIGSSIRDFYRSTRNRWSAGEGTDVANIVWLATSKAEAFANLIADEINLVRLYGWPIVQI